MTEQEMVDIVQSENAALCRTIEQLMDEIERLRAELAKAEGRDRPPVMPDIDERVEDWGH